MRGRESLVRWLEQLEALAEACLWRQPFFRRAWVESWLETAGSGLMPVALGIEEDGRLCGFWPFFEYRTILGRGLWPMVGEFADFFDPLYDGRPEVLGALAAGLENSLGRRGYAFAWVPCLSARFFEQCHRWPLDTPHPQRLIRRRERNPILRIEGSFADWEARHTSPRSRKNMRRQQRMLAARGTVAFEHWEHPDDLRSLLRLCASIERQSWKGERGRGLWSSPRFRHFYQKLLPRLAEEGRLRLDTLSVDGHYIGYQIGLREPNWYGLHSIAYLPEYAKMSPGKLLLRHFIEQCHNAGEFATLDFLQGAFDYKLRFASEVIDLHDLSLFAPTLRGRLVRWLMGHKRPPSDQSLP